MVLGGDHIKWDMDFKKDSIKGFPNLAKLSFAIPTHHQAQETKKNKKNKKNYYYPTQKNSTKDTKTIPKLSVCSSNPS
jgi:hypothetical protein